MEGQDGGWWGVLQLDDNLCDGRLKQMVVVSGQGRVTAEASAQAYTADRGQLTHRFVAYDYRLSGVASTVPPIKHILP